MKKVLLVAFALAMLAFFLASQFLRQGSFTHAEVLYRPMREGGRAFCLEINQVSEVLPWDYDYQWGIHYVSLTVSPIAAVVVFVIVFAIGALLRR